MFPVLWQSFILDFSKPHSDSSNPHIGNHQETKNIPAPSPVPTHTISHPDEQMMQPVFVSPLQKSHWSAAFRMNFDWFHLKLLPSILLQVVFVLFSGSRDDRWAGSAGLGNEEGGGAGSWQIIKYSVGDCSGTYVFLVRCVT